MGTQRPATQLRRVRSYLHYRNCTRQKRQRQPPETESQFLNGNYHIGEGSAQFKMFRVSRTTGYCQQGSSGQPIVSIRDFLDRKR